MARMTRRAALVALGVGGGLLGLGFALRDIDIFGSGEPTAGPGMMGPGMMGQGMMGSATQADMSIYMDMFNRHREIRRVVEEIPGGVRTTTESDAPELAAQLHAHVSAMYTHLAERAE